MGSLKSPINPVNLGLWEEARHEEKDTTAGVARHRMGHPVFLICFHLASFYPPPPQNANHKCCFCSSSHHRKPHDDSALTLFLEMYWQVWIIHRSCGQQRSFLTTETSHLHGLHLKSDSSVCMDRNRGKQEILVVFSVFCVS